MKEYEQLRARMAHGKLPLGEFVELIGRMPFQARVREEQYKVLLELANSRIRELGGEEVSTEWIG